MQAVTEQFTNVALDSDPARMESEPLGKIPLRGLLLSTTDRKDIIQPRGKLANIELQESQSFQHKKVHSETRTFFDPQNEAIFFSLCDQGFKDLPTEEFLEPDRSAADCRETQYISKVRHTWFLQRWFEMRSGSPFELSNAAVKSLQEISRNGFEGTSQKDVKQNICTFLSEFGSHVSLGPFAMGGRMVEKIYISDCRNLDQTELLGHLEDSLKNMDPYQLSICSGYVTRRNILLQTDGKNDQNVVITCEVHIFGGDENAASLSLWKDSLSSSSLLISGAVAQETVKPVWDIVNEYVEVFGDSCDQLSRLLKETWSEENISLAPSQQREPTNRKSLQATEETSNLRHDTRGTSNVEDMTTTYEKFEAEHTPEIFKKLHLEKRVYSLAEANILRKDVLEDGDVTEGVMWTFCRLISSLDYRGRKCLKAEPQEEPNEIILPESPGTDIFAQMAISETVGDCQKSNISAMDVTFAILHCCDDFLRQEILCKMVECRLAVPILLPALHDDGNIEFQLWGLRTIYKTWKSRVTNETPLDRSVVSQPLPIVSFVRFGECALSKSKLLNKIMGKLQGNNDHSFFVDMREERPCATFSKGTLEVAWFLPEDTFGDTNLSASRSFLRDAITFFNLRGDAMNFELQRKFACKASQVVVALVDEESYSDHMEKIRDMSENWTRHLVCVMSSSNSQTADTIKRLGNVTMIRSKQFVDDIGEHICRELNQILWPLEQKGGNQLKFLSIESLTDLCDQLNIKIDERNEDSITGKQLAHKVAERVSRSPETYKECHLPLQGQLWKKWAKLDKNWNKPYRQQGFDSMEHFQDDLKRKMLEVREEQRAMPPADDIVDIVNAFQLSKNPREYFYSWLNLYLNELSQKNLGPLRKQLRDIQKETREIHAEESKLKDKSPLSNDETVKLQRLKDQDKALAQKSQDIAAKIDSGSLGMEHYIRELGQRYEAYEELKGKAGTDVDLQINTGTLPDIAAELLIDGHPLEILDGDVGRVPIKWVQSVFRSVVKKLGNEATVSAISVIGVQSSGKSTLLNTMFGVRFAVSAGRCTRGVFIQLLKVDNNLAEQTGCNYVIVIDTEGLKAPERSFRNDFRHDNELATFALCLADLTIINIAGQTVGKDMTDVLQIAAHAFIRMKEVHIKSSCRIIQQFVADLAAVDKNEASTLGILANLDEAISAAAREEDCGDTYTRFSDVFNLKRNEEVQYIPSLWQGSMAPPNHRYSERIMKLKNLIIGDISQSKRTFQEFADRISNVWNAVKEENFIFNFKNCLIALRYKTFQHVYGKWIGDMRQSIMEWESKAKQSLKTAPKDQLRNKRLKLSNDITEVVSSEGERIRENILNYLQENITDDDDQLHKFEGEFLTDLELTERKFIQDARDTLERITDSIIQLNQMDLLLPKCKNQLREKARTQAVEFRKKNANAESPRAEFTAEEIDATFDKLLEGWIYEICKDYPPKQVDTKEVRMEFDSYLISQGEKKDLSKGLKHKLGISGGNMYRKTANYLSEKVYGDQKESVMTIIEEVLTTLKKEVDDDRAYDPSIVQKLIDSTIYKSTNISLTQEVKINAILEVCEKAIPIILKGRRSYNKKFSVGELLKKEKENLKEDFRALCTSAFQDKRASESLTSLLLEKVIDLIQSYLGPAIYKALRESCPYFSSKFAMFGYVLEDMALKEDFPSYNKFIFEIGDFLLEWSLQKIAEMCVEETAGGKSFLEGKLTNKVEDIRGTLLRVITSSNYEMESDIRSNEGSSRENDTLANWVRLLCHKLQCNLPELSLSDEDVRNLTLFEVKDINFFGSLVEQYVERELTQDIINGLHLPRKNDIKTARKFLQELPTKPHKEIQKHVSGCTEQCPICHAPCDNMTRQHEKHRAELHYPEGLVGSRHCGNNRLVCSICTSSITTTESYFEGDVYRKYSNFHKDFPSWVIQPIQNDSPLNYWKWVMNHFNKDFAQLYDSNEASLPKGWVSITKQQAIEDLREAYATRQINGS